MQIQSEMQQGRPKKERPCAKLVRRRPTLPHRLQCSTIGAEGLDFRVRNVAGYFPFAMVAETLLRYQNQVLLGSRSYLGNLTVDAQSSL